MTSSPLTMSAREAVTAIKTKKLSSLELVDAYLGRIADREKDVQAWAWLDAEYARAQARACDAKEPHGVLHGVPVGVKDMIDTQDMPTAYGSTIYNEHRPSRDAGCVALLRKAGAVILGKTVTTEFALYSPNKTKNPHNAEHTPGGSSSGSAAAVGDNHVPFALGTQTSGSIIRPAAFCGVVGYKPTFGTFPIEGVKALAASLDTLGFISRNVDDLTLLFEALHGRPLPRLLRNSGKPSIALCYPSFATLNSADDAPKLVASELETAGYTVKEISLPAWFSGLNQVHAEFMAYEVARNYVYESMPERRAQMADSTRSVIDDGWKVSFDRYLECRAQIRRARHEFDQLLHDIDAVLVPSARGEAPHGLSATGDPVFNRLWSLLGVPAITLPVAKGIRGLPLGVQLIARADTDLKLLNTAQEVEIAMRK